MSSIHILGIRQYSKTLAVAAEGPDAAAKASALKKIKELSGDQRKIILQIFYETGATHDADALKVLYKKLQAMDASDKPYSFERKNNCRLKLVRIYKNKCCHREKSKNFIHAISGYAPSKPYSPIELEELLKTTRIDSKENAMQLLNNLCDYIYKNKIYKTAGFFRVTGNRTATHALKIELCEFTQEKGRSPTVDELKTIFSSIPNVNAFEIGIVFKSIINDLPLYAKEDPEAIKEDIFLKLPSKTIKEYPLIQKKFKRLLDAIIKEKDTTLYENPMGLAAAFPAVKYLLASPE